MSTPCETSTECEVRAEEAGGALLHDTVSSSRRPSRSSISTHRAAELEVGEGRHLLEPQAAVLQGRVEPDRRVDDGGPRSSRAASSEPPGRLDLGRSGPTRARTRGR